MKKFDKYPQIIIKKGFGTFSSKEIKFESQFEITHYPQNTIIKTKIGDKKKNVLAQKNMGDIWELKGLTDENISIHAKNLLFTNLSNNDLTLFSFKDLDFYKNEVHSFTSAEFPLVGFYKGNINTTIDNWEISSNGNKGNIEIIENQCKNWNIQLEGLVLKLVKQNSSQEKYLSKANDITSLLSLALGNDIVFNRQLYFMDNELCQENWRRKADYNFGVEACVPDLNLNHFLEKTLSNYEKWTEEKKKIFHSTVTGINSSSKGFLENRLLRICVAWEGLTESWSKNKKSAKTELTPLKKLLKETIDNYNLPPNYDKSFIKTRVINSLDWEKLSDSLTNFSNQYFLDNKKLILDFRSLIKIRNDIVHSGLFRKKYSKDFLINLIYNHKLGLQVIILKELGYDGLVVTSENKWRTFTKMEELITNPAHNAQYKKLDR